MCAFVPLSTAAGGASYHVVRAEATEDADGADHLPVQVRLPSPHPVPQELPPHLSQASRPLTLLALAEWHKMTSEVLKTNKNNCTADTV